MGNNWVIWRIARNSKHQIGIALNREKALDTLRKLREQGGNWGYYATERTLTGK